MKKINLKTLVREEMKLLNLPAQKVEAPAEPLKSVKELEAWQKKHTDGPDQQDVKKSVKQIDAVNEAFGRMMVRESLTKKDFVSMVGYIKQAPQQHRDALIDFAVKISTADNPRFDEKKFRAACGVIKEIREDFIDREAHMVYQGGMEIYFDQNGNFTQAFSDERGQRVTPRPEDLAIAKQKVKQQMSKSPKNENFMSHPTPQGQAVKQEQPEPKPLLPVKKAEFHKLIGQYNEYGKVLKRSGSLREMARKLGALATLAERTVVSETDDWFDAHTVKRNMKELKSYAGEFGKYAVEADQVMERVTALYDDMGRVLERYFEIYDVSESTQLGESKAPKTEKCGRCHGQKFVGLGDKQHKCKVCNGKGRIEIKEDCGPKKYLEPQDSFDVNEIQEPSVFRKKPKDWSISDQAKAVKYYTSLSLATLRKKQDDLRKKQGEYYAATKDKTVDHEPMMNLSVLEKVLAKAVDVKAFKHESITPMSARAVSLVYEQLNEQNKAKLRTLPVSRMAEICWKLLK